jgi:hypothetical protein
MFLQIHIYIAFLYIRRFLLLFFLITISVILKNINCILHAENYYFIYIRLEQKLFRFLSL